MKKVLFMLAMLAFVLAGCSDGGNDDSINPTPKPEEVKAEITIDSSIVSNGLSFGVASGEQTISFSANTNWTLSVASTTSGATWCKASATSGSKGTADVKFTVDENTGYDDRSVSVTIKAGSVSKTFTITQKGADALLVTTNKYEVVQEGGKIEVEVKANINYELAISETAKDWITESKSKSRALTTYKHSFEITANEEVEKREGEITFKSGDKVETVKVYQAGGAVLLLSKDEFTISDVGETISVDIKSNVEYGVQMPDVDWITDEASSRGMSSHTLKYVISPNEGYDSRSAEIIFYDKNSDLKDTLKVIQAQKDAIVISQKTYDVKAEGETIEVKLSANVDFEITMPEVDWIEQVESRGLKEHVFYFKVAENEGEESREAKIMFINKETELSDIITINQTGKVKLALSKKQFNVSAAGETISVNIQSSIEYGVQMPDVDWVKQEFDDSKSSDETLKFIISANKTYDNRSAEIIFYDKNSDLKDTLKIVQAQKDAIVISQKAYEVKAEGEIIEVKLSTNVDFDLIMPEVDWVIQTESRALAEHTLYFKVAENLSEENRTTEIVFINKTSQISESISVVQEGKPVLALLKRIYNISDAGETITVELKSNREFEIQMPKVNWINRDSSGKNVTTDVLNFVILENGTSAERSAEIVFYNTEYSLSDTLFIVQNKKTVLGDLIKVSEPGTLSQIIGDNNKYSIKALKIVGKINGTDIRFLRDMAGRDVEGNPTEGLLTKLNLSEAQIVNGGDYYYKYNSYKQVIYYKTEDNVVGDNMFAQTLLKEISLPKGTVKIGYGAFEFCSILKYVEIPMGVTLIGESAFSRCYKLYDINLPASITKIGDHAFANCVFETIVLPENLDTIGSMAFYACALKSVIIPKKVKVIGDEAFTGTWITSVELPDGLKVIGNRAFRNTGLESVTIPGSVVTLGSRAFDTCPELKEVIVSEGIKRIGDAAFYGSGIKKVILPSTLEVMLVSAFKQCKKIDEIYCAAEVAPELFDVFDSSITSFCRIYIPKGSLNSYKSADYWKDFRHLIETDF